MKKLCVALALALCLGGCGSGEEPVMETVASPPLVGSSAGAAVKPETTVVVSRSATGSICRCFVRRPVTSVSVTACRSRR